MAAVQVVPTHVVGACDGQAAASDEFHYPPQLGFPVSKSFGEQLKCIPGTGSVVTYIVIHRYRYSVPTMQKNLLLIIDLYFKSSH